MAYLKYYSDERKLFAKEWTMALTKEQVKEMVVDLYDAFNMSRKSLRVVVGKRRRAVSSYSPCRDFMSPKGLRYTYQYESVNINTTMMNVRTVVHEWAHGAHTHEFDARYRKLNVIPARERWHSSKHRGWMLKGFAWLRKSERWGPMFTGSKPYTPVSDAAEAVRADDALMRHAALAAAGNWCPKCQRAHPRSHFGVTAVKHPGTMKVVRYKRQPWCKACHRDYSRNYATNRRAVTAGTVVAALASKSDKDPLGRP